MNSRLLLLARVHDPRNAVRWAITILLVLTTSVLSVIATQPVSAATRFTVPAGTQDWPTYMHDNQRSGASGEQLLSAANASQLTRLWSFKTGGAIAAQAAIVQGVAYIGSWDGNEYAINVQTGAQVWATNLGVTSQPICYPPSPGVTSSATVLNGTVYVGGGDAYWYALDAATGSILWKVYTGDNSPASGHYNYSSPLIYNGYAYIGVASNCDNPLVQGQIIQVSLATHLVVNTLNFVPNGQVGGGIWTSPTIDPATGLIYVTTGTLNQSTQVLSQALVAFDSATLTIKSFWQIPAAQSVIDSDWGTTPTLMVDAKNNQLVAAINKNGYVYAFNRANVAAGPVWEHYIAAGGDCPQCGDGSVSSSVFANGVLYVSGGNTTVSGVGYPGFVRALDPGTGNVIWEHGTVGPVIAAISYDNGLIIDGAGKTVEVLDASNGTRLYSYQTGQIIYGSAAVSAGVIVMGSVDTNIYAFSVGAPPTPPADANCPTSWTCQDIGTPAPAGAETVSAGTWNISAGGAGIAGTSDQFRLASQATTANNQIIASVTPPTTGQSGVMVRQSAEIASPFYAISLSNNAVIVQYRSAFGALTTTLNTQNSTPLPSYIEIQRQGDQFQAATSTDGTNFTLVAGTTVRFAMPAVVLTGLMASSFTNGSAGTATFSAVTVGAITNTPASVATANGCAQGWNCVDVGNPTINGGQSLSGGAWSIQGAGIGVTSAQYGDQFHFVGQSISTDATISERVVSQSSTGGNAASGLMLRASMDGNAAYYAALFAPGKGITVLYRSIAGLRSFSLLSNAATMPTYLKIARSGDYFSTYTSADGTNWLPVPLSTIELANLTGAVNIGMVTTSGVTTPVNTSAVDSVAIAASAPQPPTLCPTNWTCQDIGNPPLAGTQIYATTSWQVIGAGGDIYGVSDQFHYVSQTTPLSGDGGISAHITKLTNTDPWAKAGVMVRQSNDPGSPYYAVFATPGNGIAVQYRTVLGGGSSSVKTPGTIPTFVMVARAGTTYTGYTSSDGINWTAIPGSTQTMTNLAGNVNVGLAITSHSPTNLGVANFDTVAVSTVNSCPSAWSCADIGGATPSGAQTDANGAWSIQAGGGDIWGTADSFRLINQSLPADGYISAHVTSLTNSSVWAKAGVMLRLTADPASPYYALFVTPSSGIAMQYRSVAGGTSAQLTVVGTMPTYLAVARVGTTFTAYTSSDGASWTAVPNSTVTIASLTGNVLAGLAVTSHNVASLSTATLDTVRIGTGTLPAATCPTGWTCGDIGGATPAGTESLTTGNWSIQGGGGDIWGAADAFHFDNQSLAADGTISAHVTSQTNSSVWAKAGVMLRLTADPGSPYFAVFVTPSNGIAVQYRSVQAGTSSSIATPGTAPTYVMVKRVGTTYSGFTSSDGTTWVAIPGASITLANLTGSLLADLAVTSHNTNSVSTVTFDSVKITAGTTANPCTTGWTCADIGNVTLAGTQSNAAGVWTVQGSGGDIYGIADSFRFVNQSLAADGGVSAHVTSQANTSVWAKAGVMLRLTADPASPNYSLFVSPTSGIVIQYRSVAGGTTQQIKLPGAAPTYLKVARVGTAFTAYTSTDGVTWTALAGPTVTLANLTGPLLAGLAVTSHNNKKLCTVTFDSVTIQ